MYFLGKYMYFKYNTSISSHWNTSYIINYGVGIFIHTTWHSQNLIEIYYSLNQLNNTRFILLNQGLIIRGVTFYPPYKSFVLETCYLKWVSIKLCISLAYHKIFLWCSIFLNHSPQNSLFLDQFYTMSLRSKLILTHLIFLSFPYPSVPYHWQLILRAHTPSRAHPHYGMWVP